MGHGSRGECGLGNGVFVGLVCWGFRVRWQLWGWGPETAVLVGCWFMP